MPHENFVDKGFSILLFSGSFQRNQNFRLHGCDLKELLTSDELQL